MPRPRVILFDLDGTLRDTRELIFSAVEYVLRTHVGKVPKREALVPYIHHHHEIYKNFASHIDEKQFLKTYGDKIDELRPVDAGMYADAAEVLEKLKSAGYKLGVVTSATTAAAYVAAHDIEHFFDVVIGGNDTVEHKPSPIPVQAALTALQATPAEAVMVGDLPADIQAANAAGIEQTIGITHGFGSKQVLKDAGATKVVDSLKEIPKAIEELS